MKPTPYPIIDLHCDLLSYLAKTPNASIHNTEDIGVALPFLKAGHVKHQVLAIFAPTQKGSVALAQKQVKAYKMLLQEDNFYPITSISDAQKIPTSSKIGVTVAIENASGLCEEDEPLELTFKRLDDMIMACGHLFYIGFTHHTENRFGGGNYSNNIGLKEDGKRLLEYMDNKKIAVDLAHTSDNLAYDMLNHIDAKSLNIPVIASHSNFRNLWNHVRNLPPELVKAINQRQGLIGMNFLRAYIHETNPDYFINHILQGLKSETTLQHIAFGADFFYRFAITAPERIPLFFKEHEDASKYPIILKTLEY